MDEARNIKRNTKMKRVAVSIVLAILLAAAARVVLARHASAALANAVALGVAALALRASALLVGRRTVRGTPERGRNLIRLKA